MKHDDAAPPPTMTNHGLPWVLRTGMTILGRMAVCLWFFLVIFAWLPRHWNRVDDMRDTPIYYHVAQRALTDQPIYQTWPDYGPDKFLNRYFYPPSFVAVITPVGLLSLQTFSNLWYLILLAAFWIYAWCLATLACGRASVFNVMTSGFLTWMFPFSWLAMSYGNAEPLIWALLGLALVSKSKGRGVALALAALIKVHPALVLLISIRREGKAVALPAAAILSLGLIVGCLAFGPGVYVDWWEAVPPVIGQGSFNHANVSLSFAGLRAAKEFGWQYIGGPLPQGARVYLMFMALIGPLLTIFLTRKCKPILQYALVANAVMLFAPLCWHMYLPALLAPLAILFRQSNQKRADGQTE